MRVSFLFLRDDKKHIRVSMFSGIFAGKHMRVFCVWGSYDWKHMRVSRSKLCSVDTQLFSLSA